MEQTFVMLKPGVLQRRIAGHVISRLEQKGLRVIAMKLMSIEEGLAREHYAEHKERDFFPDLISYITSGPVVAMVVAGDGAISRVRTLAGATKVEDARPGTIRGDFAAVTRQNIIHASDSPASSEREVALFFASKEIHDWEDPNGGWIE